MADVREFCTLSDEELAARRRALRRELLPHVRRRDPLPDGLVLAFDPSSERRRALEAFVAFEEGCCPGLRFVLRQGSGADDALLLEIHGLDPASHLFPEDD